jgi:hypothetical protein
MARKTKHRSKAKFTLPLSVVAGFAPGVSYAIAGYKAGGFKGATNSLAYAYGGFDVSTGKFNMAGLYHGLIPAIGGFLIHMVAGKIGINRALGRAGVPFIRI